MKPTQLLTSKDIKRMPLDEFEKKFGFRPKNAMEKYFFACNGERASQLTIMAMEAGVIGKVNTDDIIMN